MVSLIFRWLWVIVIIVFLLAIIAIVRLRLSRKSSSKNFIINTILLAPLIVILLGVLTSSITNAISEMINAKSEKIRRNEIREDMIDADTKITLESEIRIQRSSQNRTENLVLLRNSKAFKNKMIKDAVMHAVQVEEEGRKYIFDLYDNMDIKTFFIVPKWVDQGVPTLLTGVERARIETHFTKNPKQDAILMVRAILSDEIFIENLTYHFTVKSENVHLTLSDKAAIIVGYINTL